jgi:hypothetical protein
LWIPNAIKAQPYRVSGWSQLGQTSGWKRCAADFYEQHDQPKQIWVRELARKARVKLRAGQLPLDWAMVEEKVAPRCTAKVGEITSLTNRLQREVPEFRRKQALAYWVIESRLHQTLDVTLQEDQSRVRQPNAALVLGLFRRVVVSLALTWVAQARKVKPHATARNFQK